MRTVDLKRFCALMLSVLILITMMSSPVLADGDNDAPGSDQDQPQSYTITVNPDITYGTIEVQQEAEEGEKVSFVLKPAEGYVYQDGSAAVKDQNEAAVSLDEGADACTFDMPASDVTITAEFTGKESNVTVSPAENGSVQVQSPTAHTGESVTLTILPESHYELKSLQYQAEGSEPVEITEHTSDTAYSFTMPGTDVTIIPEFTKIIYSIYAKADHGTVEFSDDNGNSLDGAAYFSRVNIKVTPDDGYILKDIYAVDEKETPQKGVVTSSSGRYYISGMPDMDLTVVAEFVSHTHKPNLVDRVEPTCEANGNIQYWYCEGCNSYFRDADASEKISRRSELVLPATGHAWGAWKVVKEPTATTAGEKKRVCKHDSSHVETQKIPATGKKEEPAKKPDPAPAPTPAPAPEKKTKKSSEKAVLLAKASTTGMNQVTISWNKIQNADRYVILFGKCNEGETIYEVKKIKTVKARISNYTVKNLENGKCYKYRVIAQKKAKGKYKNITKSLLNHTIVGNVSHMHSVPKSLKLNKKAVSLKKKKTFKLKGKIALFDADKEIMSHAAALRFVSSDPSVATVSTSGKIKAKKKGKCTIYVQTINGICKKCKVTVK